MAESRIFEESWTPAFAGVTVGPSFEIVSNRRSWDIPPRGGLADLLHIDDLPGLRVNIDERNRRALYIEGKKAFLGQAIFSVVIDLYENDSPYRTDVALESLLVHTERAVMPSGHGRIDVVHRRHFRRRRTPQMVERMHDPVGYESYRVVVLVKVKCTTGIGNHPLHHIICRHDVAQVISVSFQKGEF